MLAGSYSLSGLLGGSVQVGHLARAEGLLDRAQARVVVVELEVRVDRGHDRAHVVGGVIDQEADRQGGGGDRVRRHVTSLTDVETPVQGGSPNCTKAPAEAGATCGDVRR